MLTMTFKDFYQTDWDEGQHELYILKRGSDVLYIGISERGIWNRWFGGRSSHILSNLWGEKFPGSEVGRAVLENALESADWIMELWTVQDCADFLTEYSHLKFTSIRQVEPFMIEELKPSLNVIFANYQKKQTDLIDRSHLAEAHRKIFG
jgi:hypothetical protein